MSNDTKITNNDLNSRISKTEIQFGDAIKDIENLKTQISLYVNKVYTLSSKVDNLDKNIKAVEARQD